MDSVFVAMDLIRLSTCFDEPSDVFCTRCHEELTLHQLDVQLPARILGTCEGCKAWYLIDIEKSLMVLLPDEDDLRNA